MSPTTFIQAPHGLACDGCGIAKDDLHAIETMEKKEQVIHELFNNAARIRKAMRSNHLLRPIFRKYEEACREIWNQKKEVAEQLARLADYCDDCAHDQHMQRHDLNCIQTELNELYDQTKPLEEMQWTDEDSVSECSSDSEDEHAHDGETHGECNSFPELDDSVDSVDTDDTDDTDDSVDTDDTDDSGLSDVMEFLRQSQID
jgi:hypothetical protein